MLVNFCQALDIRIKKLSRCRVGRHKAKFGPFFANRLHSNAKDFNLFGKR